MLQRTDFAGGR